MKLKVSTELTTRTITFNIHNVFENDFKKGKNHFYYSNYVYILYKYILIK